MKKIVIAFYIVVVAVMAIATIVEKYEGTPYAADHIYGSWWFSVLWALLTAVGLAYMLQLRVRRLSVWLVHTGFVVILLGALVTHLWGRQGIVHLRKGLSADTYLVQRDGGYQEEKLPFSLMLRDFTVNYYPGTETPSDYQSVVLAETRGHLRRYEVSMNHIARCQGWRPYQSSYDDDMEGSILAVNYDPWGIRITYTGYALLLLALIWMLCDPKGIFRRELNHEFGRTSTDETAAMSKPTSRKRRRLLTVLWLFVGGFWLWFFFHLLLRDPAAHRLMPVLNSPWLAVHVSIIVVGYLLLGLSAVSRMFLPPAIAALSAGIFIGALWANVSWGTYWSWDPKETWALITLMVYAVPLHARSLPWFRSDSHYRLYVLLALLTIAMTYFGVNYFLGGMHSYA